MTPITVGNLTLNLDNVAYWVVRPEKQGAISSSSLPDEPVITVHFVGNTEPLSLYPPSAATFLRFAKANLNIQTIST